MIRLIIADDHPVVREGLKRLISSYPDMEIVAEAVNGKEILKLLNKYETDIVLLDISMPDGKFLDTMQRLRRGWPDTKILVLSIHPEDKYALRALKAGAYGYLTKDHSPEELAFAIRHIFNGNKYITPALGELLLTNHEQGNIENPHERLSNREYEILCMLGSGKQLKEIAVELSLSPKTVSTHRANILEKLGLKNTSELIRYAMDHELTT